MRVSLPVLALLAATAALAAVYVTGTAPDNGAGGSAQALPAAMGGMGAGMAGAGAGAADGAARPQPAGLNTGAVAAFVYKGEPASVPSFSFFDAKKETQTISSFKGRVVLLNLWATWCPPCRAEMPSLDRLQKDMGSDKFEVVALNVDKNGFDKAREFLSGADIKSLAFYADPTSRAALTLNALGMPVTVLVDADGREIGRLTGPAEWDSPDAKRLIEAALR